ncbi:MAG: amino acid ABC transporter substrate-binding protein [Pseudomonadota bacterium]
MKLALSMWTLAAAALLSPAAQAVDTLDRIKTQGTMRLGVRADSGGLSYSWAEGNYGGFHVELCQRVIADLEKQLGRKITVQWVPVTGQTRLFAMANGTTDMECGATTNNLTRQKDLAFAVTTYVEEVRAVVRKDSGIRSIQDMGGKAVATSAGTTSLPLLRKWKTTNGQEIKEVVARSDTLAFALLAEGKADAFVMDSQILAAFISNSGKPDDYRLLSEVLSVEPIAIMLPKDDPAFKKTVDESLKALMRSGEIQKIYSKWLLEPIPPNRVKINLPLSEATKKAWAEPNDRPVESY